MNAGWCWRIPVEGEDHRGYVFVRPSHRGPGPRRDARQESGNGRHLDGTFPQRSPRGILKGNTVAVGNAYGFVEPLESTALHMVIMEMRVLLRCLRTSADGQWDRAFANRSVGSHWDYLRWFLAMHYRFNRKSDSEFWRVCRDTVDVSGIEPMLERFRREGPVKEGGVSPHAIPDPVFNYFGVVTMLLGQQVPLPTARRDLVDEGRMGRPRRGEPHGDASRARSAAGARSPTPASRNAGALGDAEQQVVVHRPHRAR
jgi:tryptophan halogenase